MIVAAACRINQMICTMPQPARHHDILHQIHGFKVDILEGAESKIQYYDYIEGFITDKGEFLERKMALIHAREHGQGTPRRDAMIASGYKAYDGDELYSEDLW